MTRMTPNGDNFCATVRYVVFSCLLGVCYGFVLLSSAVGAGSVADDVLVPGNAWSYDLLEEVSLDELAGSEGKDVAFRIKGTVNVEVVWGKDGDRVVKLTLQNAKLLVSEGQASKEGEKQFHTTKLTSHPNSPSFFSWSNGKIDKIRIRSDNPLPFKNLIKAIASLFQFQLTNTKTNETDVSGLCETTYALLTETQISKTKERCISPDFPQVNNPEKLFGTHIKSLSVALYDISPDSSCFKSVELKESQQVSIALNEDTGIKLKNALSLRVVEERKVEIIGGESKEEVFLDLVDKEDGEYVDESLLTEREFVKRDKKLSKVIEELRGHLKSEALGTVESAKAFVKVIGVSRLSSSAEVNKVLNAKKNQNILPQLYDIFGYAQTEEVHEGVMKTLHLEKSSLADFSERYLWACSISSQPNPEILKDLLNKYRKLVEIPQNVKETLVLTLASMVSRLWKLPQQTNSRKMIREVEEMLKNELLSAKEDRLIFLRAYRHLKSPTSIQTLIDVIKSGSPKEQALAFRALHSLDRSLWKDKILKVAREVFFQLDKKYDSSARTLAADVLLDDPPKETLKELLYYLLANDTAFEVKQYVLQKIRLTADNRSDFKEKVKEIIIGDGRLNNYNVMALKGLSTALARKFMEGRTNGSLISTQEIFGGIVKRGTVDVVLEKINDTQDVFSLGIFTRGLTSFVSSDSNKEEESEDPTAGMELTVMGTQIRPFTFFSSQSQLMGHVFSGTASDRTTAFQALIMLQDHLEYIRLGCGLIAKVDVKGAASFDLAGKVEISLWNRNSKSHVEKSAGIFTQQIVVIDVPFVKAKVDVSLSVEPKLNLNTDLDFYNDVSLCMRLSQPDTVLQISTRKSLVEPMKDNLEKIRFSKHKKYTIPGKTYALNQKNNDMCRAIFA